MKPFDLHGLKTYDLQSRPSKVFVEDLGKPASAGTRIGDWLDSLPRQLAANDLRRVRDRVASEVEQLYARARTALLQHEIFFTTHIPQAEEALRVTEAAYQSGSADFLALMDTVRAALAVHLEHVAAQADFEKAMAELERAVGSEIPGHASGAPEGPHGGRTAGASHG